MATLTRLHDFETDRDATPPVLFSATKVDAEFDQIITESNAQDVRLDTIEAVTYLPVDATIAATDTHIIVADGTDFDNVAVSGDATLSNTGVLTIAVDAIDGTKIADDSIDSEHYTDGSIDLAHLSADSVDGTKIADDAIDSEHYTDGSIDDVHLATGISSSKLTGALPAIDGSSLTGMSTFSETVVTPTANQTVFNFTYTVGKLQVYFNGVKLLNTTDFTASNGTTVVLGTGATVNDKVEFVKF